MARFAAFITAALLLAAAGNAVSEKAHETMNNYRTSVDSHIAAAR